MASLYKRATPAQRLVLRMVAGAVKNAAHHHPEWGLPEYAARSIAKRAAGTLTAQWPEVLAMSSTSSDSAVDVTCLTSQPLPGRSLHRAGRGALTRGQRTPLSKVKIRLGIMAGEARRAGDTARFEALADALRVVASVEKKK